MYILSLLCVSFLCSTINDAACTKSSDALTHKVCYRKGYETASSVKTAYDTTIDGFSHLSTHGYTFGVRDCVKETDDTTPEIPTAILTDHDCFSCCIATVTSNVDSVEYTKWRLLYTINENIIPDFTDNLTTNSPSPPSYIYYASSAIDTTCSSSKCTSCNFINTPHICDYPLPSNLTDPFIVSLWLDTTNEMVTFYFGSDDINGWLALGIGPMDTKGDAIILSDPFPQNSMAPYIGEWILNDHHNLPPTPDPTVVITADSAQGLIGSGDTFYVDTYFVNAKRSYTNNQNYDTITEQFTDETESITVYAAWSTSNIWAVSDHGPSNRIPETDILITPADPDTKWCSAVIDCASTVNDCCIFLSSPSPTAAPTDNPTAPTKPPTYFPTNNPTNNPTHTPTSNPTLIPTNMPTTQPTTALPTEYPTQRPTISPTTPTNMPTNQPTDATETPTRNPSAKPTHDPTLPPSNAPSVSPSETPTDSPSSSPTFDPWTLVVMKNQQDINNLEQTYQTVVTLFSMVFGSTALAAFVDAKFVRSNDYFKISQITGIALQALDMLSDCFFSVNVSYRNKIDSTYFLPLLLSIFFIVVPATMTIVQLYMHSTKHWTRSSDQVRGWLASKSKALYLISIFCGNSFVAVSLVNSYIFKLNFFDMGLTDKELSAFGYKRVYSVVLLENVPQVLLQCWFLYSLKEFDDPITISSIVFSLISIIVSVLSMLMQKSLTNSQGYVEITMKVTGTPVTQNAKNCKTMKQKLSKDLAAAVGGHSSAVEIIKPTAIPGGFAVTLNFYFGDLKGSFYKIKYAEILLAAQNDGGLQEIFKQGWKLKDTPIVEIISHHEVQSKVEQKRSKKDKNTLTKSVVSHQAKNVEMTQIDTNYDDDKLPVGDKKPNVDDEIDDNGNRKGITSPNKGYGKILMGGQEDY
eukprot:113762_1